MNTLQKAQFSLRYNNGLVKKKKKKKFKKNSVHIFFWILPRELQVPSLKFLWMGVLIYKSKILKIQIHNCQSGGSLTDNHNHQKARQQNSCQQFPKLKKKKESQKQKLREIIFCYLKKKKKNFNQCKTKKKKFHKIKKKKQNKKQKSSFQ